ncbi:MAG: hypothetical protein K2Z81_12735 [Cyanobacteria bacterium]|nr:hypothetical protein [Cyanobacteriota bacterium]
MNSGDRKGRRRRAGLPNGKHNRKQPVLNPHPDQLVDCSPEDDCTDFPMEDFQAAIAEDELSAPEIHSEPQETVTETDVLQFNPEEEPFTSQLLFADDTTYDAVITELSATVPSPEPVYDQSNDSYNWKNEPSHNTSEDSNLNFSISPRSDYLDSLDLPGTNFDIAENGYNANPYPNSNIQGEIEQAVQSVVQLAGYGAFNFLSRGTAPGMDQAGFSELFRQQMEIEFGKENGEFLYERYRRNRVSPNVKEKIDSVREYVTTLYRTQQTAIQASLKQVLSSIMTTSYHNGGLDSVDETIKQVNSGLRASGSRFGLGPGAACEQDDDGNPAWLAIMFADLETNQLLSMEWCQLQGSSQLPTNQAVPL